MLKYIIVLLFGLGSITCMAETGRVNFYYTATVEVIYTCDPDQAGENTCSVGLRTKDGISTEGFADFGVKEGQKVYLQCYALREDRYCNENWKTGLDPATAGKEMP